MNPFALHGFAFLAFYLMFAAAVVVALKLWFVYRESRDDATRLQFNDPYLIAYLRGGQDEALRVATVSLTDRGLLVIDGDKVRRKNGMAAEGAQRDIEKAVLHAFRTAQDSNAVLADPGARNACRGYQQTLEKHGLLASSETYMQRLGATALALLAIVGTAGYKVQLALSQGRHNIGFLIALAVVFSIFALALWRYRRTRAGDETVKDLKQLFKRLKDRATNLKRGGATNELAMLLGVFGLAAAPATAFPFIDSLYPKPKSDGGSSCSSSSSCGSSCGGGCGGGGCGGE